MKGKISSLAKIDVGVADVAAPTPASALPVVAVMKFSTERNRQGKIRNDE
ncbi:hypothetical protein [Dyadobacter luteus]|nr:hypothetical protein [Dyadobacter luteus]